MRIKLIEMGRLAIATTCSICGRQIKNPATLIVLRDPEDLPIGAVCPECLQAGPDQPGGPDPDKVRGMDKAIAYLSTRHLIGLADEPDPLFSP